MKDTQPSAVYCPACRSMVVADLARKKPRCPSCGKFFPAENGKTGEKRQHIGS